jgi:hypothetical protein
VQVRVPSVQVRVPSVQVRVPSVQVRVPSVQVRVPSVQVLLAFPLLLRYRTQPVRRTQLLAINLTASYAPS